MRKSNIHGLLSLLLSGVALGAALPSQAQTAYGPGGLFIHPTAFTPPKGSVSLSVSHFSVAGGPTSNHWLPVGVTYGVSDKAQLGALYLNRSYGGTNASSGGVFGKFQLVPDSPNRPAIGIAASVLSGDIELMSAAGVASHRFVQGDRVVFIGHAGVQGARWRDFPEDFESDVRVFAGGQIPLNRSWSIVGEAGTKFKFDRKATSALGLMWMGPRGISLGFGYVNAGRSSKNTFFIGVGFPIGGSNYRPSDDAPTGVGFPIGGSQ